MLFIWFDLQILLLFIAPLETRVKVVLTSEIKNPFTLLSHPFGGWPREKQLSDWQRRRETERQREGFNKGGSLERNRKVERAV